MSARNELDTRADTICVGKNWRLLSTTGQCCNVHGFHAAFDSIKDVPVSRSATAVVDKHGDTYILIVNKALYFGPDMDHSLINPNQMVETEDWVESAVISAPNGASRIGMLLDLNTHVANSNIEQRISMANTRPAAIPPKSHPSWEDVDLLKSTGIS